ncbi:MAG: hypothetical protein JWO95_1901 [Verrucomicrobiales bacterium]|nr:hypothetical protein [Verrucomicrobiales bacterium]
MPLELKSIHIGIPDHKPFDRSDWFEAFVANFVKPIVESGLVDSYWFTRYQDPKKNARLRIKTQNASAVAAKVANLVLTYQLTDRADETNYDGAEFRGPQFVGVNTRQINPTSRQELIWGFLSASAGLYLDTFSHSDQDGYWYREQNHDRGNNIDGETMESPHHLFCNMTDVRPRVDLLETINQQGFMVPILIASHSRRWQGISDEVVRVSQRVNF